LVVRVIITVRPRIAGGENPGDASECINGESRVVRERPEADRSGGFAGLLTSIAGERVGIFDDIGNLGEIREGAQCELGQTRVRLPAWIEKFLELDPLFAVASSEDQGDRAKVFIHIRLSVEVDE